MSGDQDLKGFIPDPPPPAPTRREAAIEEAMRRFEDERPASGQDPKSRGKDRPGWLPRPQVGAWVTVGLMLLIGLPAAWMTANRDDERAPPAPMLAQRESTPAAADASRPPAAAPAAPAAFSPRAPKVREAPPPAIVAAAPKVGAPVIVTEAIPQPPAVIVPAEGALAQRDEPSGSTARNELLYAPAPVAPPPPPAIVFTAPRAAAPATVAAKATAADNVVVTGSRAAPRRADRGDWNACTVDDPYRNLALCASVIDSAAPGSDGIAAAHLADGLSRAWQGDLDGAVHAFDAAIAIAPKLSRAYLNRSLAYAHQGEEARALADADQAVRYGRESAQAYYTRSVLLRRQGQIDRARADENRAVEIDPHYEAALPR